MIPIQEDESLNAFFDGYVHKHTSFKEFVDKYDLALHRKHMKEAMADLESTNSSYEFENKHATGVEEVPSRYILPRWGKDYKRRGLLDHNSGDVDVDNRIYWHNLLYRYAIPVVEVGAQSSDHYKIALQELEELLNKFNIAEDNLV
ncbi:hypothetical protein NC652_017920 [Populus alba x Populus x berolinensis]|nr:hypothetical protein NC652_017920 [Populus alba x Populus x berolinensis]